MSKKREKNNENLVASGKAAHVALKLIVVAQSECPILPRAPTVELNPK